MARAWVTHKVPRHCLERLPHPRGLLHGRNIEPFDARPAVISVFLLTTISNFPYPTPVHLLSQAYHIHAVDFPGLLKPMNLPRLLLADDHAGTRNLLRLLLEPEFNVIADVADGQALVSAAGRLAPDVIVTDISMPCIDGITAAAAILCRNPEARIVLITVYSDGSLLHRGLSSGAMGYVLKGRAGDELVPAVHAALRGERYVSRTFEVVPRDYERLLTHDTASVLSESPASILE